MSSTDTMRYAESEEDSAKAIQQEIDRQLVKISELQKDIKNNIASQGDVDREQQILNGLQQKHHEHTADAQRLRQKAADEQKQEQQEELRKQQSGDGLGKKVAKGIARGGLFG